MKRACWVAAGVLAGLGVLWAQDGDAVMAASTTKERAEYHVVFTETIDSTAQGDWTESYGASVVLEKDGRKILEVRGSTLPNYRSGRGKPADWKYSVVQATSSFEGEYQGAFYTWTRGKRADGERECLRLAPQVRTVVVGNGPASLFELLGEAADSRAFKVATNILVHSGWRDDWRGSAGCLTIDPDQAPGFFAQIPMGTKGTLEINRGLHDLESGTSHNF